MCHIGHPWPVKRLGVAARRLLLAHLSCVIVNLLMSLPAWYIGF